MVLAAGSVTVFGCIGIAAITGYLPLAKASALPMGAPAIVETLEAMAPSLNKLDAHQTVVVVDTRAHALGDAATDADRGASGGAERLRPGLAGKKPSLQ